MYTCKVIIINIIIQFTKKNFFDHNLQRLFSNTNTFLSHYRHAFEDHEDAMNFRGPLRAYSQHEFDIIKKS